MQKVITVTVTSGAGRYKQTNQGLREDLFVAEHEFDKVNEALNQGYKVINVIQTAGSNTGNLHPSVIITFVLDNGAR